MSDEILSLDEYFVQTGQIYILDEIKNSTFVKVSKQLRYINYLGLNPVKIYINSSGGELEAALGIIDEFQLFIKNNKDIYTIGIGEACSAAAFILAHGTKRFATENATILLHPMSYSLSESEHQANKSYVNFAEKVYNNIMTSTAMRCGRKSDKSIRKFISDIRDGLWLDTEGAIEFGLVDDIWDYSQEKSYA